MQKWERWYIDVLVVLTVILQNTKRKCRLPSLEWQQRALYVCVLVRHKHGCSFWAPPQDFTKTAGFKWASICDSLLTDSLKFIKKQKM